MSKIKRDIDICRGCGQEVIILDRMKWGDDGYHCDTCLHGNPYIQVLKELKYKFNFVKN